MSIAQRISDTFKRDGLSGLVLRSAVASLRRIGWRAEEWSKDLDSRLARKAILRQYSSLLKRNEQFRDKHAGKRCFVIGNGPSLRSQDLRPLTNELTFVTNFFNRHSIITTDWQPTYYFLSDPAYFDGREPISSLQEIAAAVPQVDFFVPHHGVEFIRNSGIFAPEKVYYIAPSEDIPDSFVSKPDLTKPVPGVQTVVQMAIMAAIFMGCSPIYLLGLDHDWLSHGGNHLNFYSQEEADEQPDGNLPGWTYHTMMDAVMTMWKVYELHQRIAEATNIKIINCTSGGFLDVFPRARYEDVVEQKV